MFFINYSNRQRKIESKIQKCSLKLKKFSNFRLLFFLLFILSFLLWYVQFRSPVYFLFPVLVLSAFFLFVYFYSKTQKYLKRLKRSEILYKKELNRQKLNFSGYVHKINLKEDLFAQDLYIVGKYSLFHLLDTSFSIESENLLLNNLLRRLDDSINDVQIRQNKIREICKKPVFAIKYLRVIQEDIFGKDFRKKTIAWKNIKVARFWENYKILHRTFRLLVGITFLSLLSNFIFQIPLISIFFFLHLIIFLSYRKDSLKIIKRISFLFHNNIDSLKNLALFLKKNQFLESNETKNFSTEEIEKAFKELEVINSRLNWMPSFALYFFLNLFFFFDLWILSRYNRFQKKYALKMLYLMEEIIIFDSLFPFVNFQIQNPQYNFPEIQEHSSEIHGESLSHPLIEKKKQVSNHLELVKEGEIVLITGSNMAGKTTYLRTIGINIILALCGSVICGKNLKLPFLEVCCSISNFDSLKDGFSFFYAEVKKITTILQKIQTNQKRKFLILLDEIFKGTNSYERTVASKMIMKMFRNQLTFTFIASHDIELVQEEVINKHFTENIQNNEMVFDYKIKEGMITSTNALKILEIEMKKLK